MKYYVNGIKHLEDFQCEFVQADEMLAFLASSAAEDPVFTFRVIRGTVVKLEPIKITTAFRIVE